MKKTKKAFIEHLKALKAAGLETGIDGNKLYVKDRAEFDKQYAIWLETLGEAKVDIQEEVAKAIETNNV